MLASDSSLTSDSERTGSSQKRRGKESKTRKYWMTIPSPDSPGEVELSTHTFDVGVMRQLEIIARRAREEEFESVIALFDNFRMVKTSD